MNLHRQGSSNLLKGYLKQLSLTTKVVIQMSEYEGYKGFHFFEPRIVGRQMVVRAQSWILMRFDEKANTHEQHRWPEHPRNTTVCAHLDLGWKHTNRLTDILRCKLGHARHQTPLSCITCRANIRCLKYPTEIQLSIEPPVEGNSKIGQFMLIVTRWQLIGDGISPFGREWASRLRWQCEPWP